MASATPMDGMQEEFVSVAQQIWQLARHAPDRTAIVSDFRSGSFRELVHEASALAQCLSSIQARSGVIAVATDDCWEMTVAALAAWRSGCAYLPVDPAGPRMRLRQMLTDADVQFVMTGHRHHGCVPDSRCREIRIDDLPSLSSADVFSKDWMIRPQDVAYVVYTSGSTGEAKGVAISQANLAHLTRWHQRAFDVGPDDRGTQFAHLTFDAAVLETWPLLAAGASLYVPDRSVPLQPERLRDFLTSQQITICFAVTPIAEQLLFLAWPSETRLRYLLTGADTLHTFPRAHIPFRLVNNYGPSECTVLVTSGIVAVQNGQRGLPSIGQPISGVEIHLIDSEFRPVPDGEEGQIAVSGASVGLGYVGRPELTAERFKIIPWISDSPVYLTGDAGRKLPNREIEFCGRIDDQIKIRGYRIEPGEVAAALKTHPAVAAVVVSAIGDEANRHLAAYLVLTTDVTASDLRKHVETRIPAYMVPGCFVRVQELPITANGKVDRRALPAPDGSNMLQEGKAAAEHQSDIQSSVASILSELLGGRQLRLDDNFFAVGGNSMLAAQVIARLHKSLKVDLPLRTVFRSPTIAALSSEIERRIGTGLSA
ncbi:MAG: non-ribosomal peptide synthetase [Acidobacteriaceae bacterium]|nr:non-ribosomal peptide synthetase [Acidobacteriaceae bacterium]